MSLCIRIFRHHEFHILVWGVRNIFWGLMVSPANDISCLRPSPCTYTVSCIPLSSASTALFVIRQLCSKFQRNNTTSYCFACHLPCSGGIAGTVDIYITIAVSCIYPLISAYVAILTTISHWRCPASLRSCWNVYIGWNLTCWSRIANFHILCIFWHSFILNLQRPPVLFFGLVLILCLLDTRSREGREGICKTLFIWEALIWHNRHHIWGSGEDITT